ncbi:hypothetical protein ABK249_33855, partial [Neorhizobium sp. Rsf11]
VNDFDGLFDIDWRQWWIGSSSQGKVAHLAFDAALIAAMRSERHTLLQDFGEHGVMKGAALSRGEWRQTR